MLTLIRCPGSAGAGERGNGGAGERGSGGTGERGNGGTGERGNGGTEDRASCSWQPAGGRIFAWGCPPSLVAAEETDQLRRGRAVVALRCQRRGGGGPRG